MDSSTTFKNTGTTNSNEVAPEFGTWPVETEKQGILTEVRHQFDNLLSKISTHVSSENGRYLSLVKTKLEEACLFAVKAIAKPAKS